MQHGSVGQAQRRNLADGIAGVELLVTVDWADVHRLQCHSVQLAGFVQYHHDLAHEWRQGRVEQGHGAHAQFPCKLAGMHTPVPPIPQ